MTTNPDQTTKEKKLCYKLDCTAREEGIITCEYKDCKDRITKQESAEDIGNSTCFDQHKTSPITQPLHPEPLNGCVWKEPEEDIKKLCKEIQEIRKRRIRILDTTTDDIRMLLISFSIIFLLVMITLYIYLGILVLYSLAIIIIFFISLFLLIVITIVINKGLKRMGI